MKRLLLIALSLVLITPAMQAQILQPVSWTYEKERVSDTEVDLIFKATMDEGWYMYGTDFPDGGPIKFAMYFDESDAFEPTGDLRKHPPMKEKYDSLFNMKVNYLEGKVRLTQRIQIYTTEDFQVTGELEYQVCKEQCVMNTPSFEFSVKGAPKGAIAESKPEEKAKEKTKAQASDKDEGGGAAAIQTQELDLDGSDERAQTAGMEEAEQKKSIKQQTQNPQFRNKSLWGFFWISFLAGLLAIFTPCVFPMIPMTVTFFMKGSANKAKGRFQASIYGASIIAIYTIIGTVVAVTLGASFANFLSTHWLPNVLFFLIFLFFSISFLGAFEITVPSWMINKADSQSERGGLTGAFFMAFTLVLVSFSCTGPLVGAILVESAGGEVIQPIIGMLGFSLAFALPFTLFAFFPSWLSGLPQSGGWLNSVKVVLGFLELALGLKFLSIADQTYHWGILDRHIYLALWIVIFALIGFYLLGKIRMPNDSKLEKISVTRMLLAIVTFSFVVYMIPGLWGAPLKMLSGYLPPQTTQDFDINRVVRENAATSGTAKFEEHNTMCGEAKYHEFLEIPHGLKGYFDYQQGLKCAQKLDKPVFLDFTGHGCVNCREMEARVWSDPRVLKRLREEYVIISLYIDDKTKLPEPQWTKSEYDGKVKKTIGGKNAAFQISRFGVNAQPYYVLLDPQGNKLIEPMAYDLDEDNFVRFLDKGIEAYESKQE